MLQKHAFLSFRLFLNQGKNCWTNIKEGTSNINTNTSFRLRFATRNQGMNYQSMNEKILIHESTMNIISKLWMYSHRLSYIFWQSPNNVVKSLYWWQTLSIQIEKLVEKMQNCVFNCADFVRFVQALECSHFTT